MEGKKTMKELVKQGTAVQVMTDEQLVSVCIWLDREQKKSRAMMNRYKAELQARGLSLMEDHNVKYVKFYGGGGSAAVTGSGSW